MVGATSTLLWLYIISGIKEVSRVKRVMMNVENPDASAQNTLKEQLLTVPGVLEVTFNTQSDAVYLKVDRDFDAIKARAVIRPI
jgi:cell division protein FtsX